jgi:molecular chaperone DnaK
MQQDAEINAEADKEKKELAEAKNVADSMINTAEKALRDSAGKISDEIKTDVEAKVSALKDKKDTASLDEIKTLSNELGDSMQKIGEEMMRRPDQSQDANTEETTEEQAEGQDIDKETKEDTKTDNK